MKSLTLFRHAKTERDSTTGRDFDRQLAERGERDAARIGEEIRKMGVAFDVILSSPAARAAQTAELAGLAPHFDDRIYNASAGQLLAIVQETEGSETRLLLIGHNPGLEQLATMMLGAQLEMATGTLAEIELPIGNWREAGAATGRLVLNLRPGGLG